MRKKSSILLAGLLALSAGSAKADEGMWTLYNLPQAVYEQMKTYGFNLPYDGRCQPPAATRCCCMGRNHNRKTWRNRT